MLFIRIELNAFINEELVIKGFSIGTTSYVIESNLRRHHVTRYTNNDTVTGIVSTQELPILYGYGYLNTTYASPWFIPNCNTESIRWGLINAPGIFDFHTNA